MYRYLKKYIIQDLKKKMVFVGGPRQVGKTTLAIDLATKKHKYFNWDVHEDKQFILHQQTPKESFIIFDEIHKYNRWRDYVKGLYDKYKLEKKFLITGSARLDYYRYSGDSLQGRYFHYRLHPLSVAELSLNTQKDFMNLLNLGGFPEPFFSGSKKEAKRWANDYQKRFIYEEVTSLEQT